MITLGSIRNGLRDILVAEARRIRMPEYTVTDVNVPYDYITRTYRETGRLIVWAGHCDKAVFDTRSNYLFRAWHDWAHIRSGIGFTVANEQDVARFQLSEISSTLFSQLVYIEVAEQAKYFDDTGEFLDDQVAFTIEKLRQYA